MTVSGLAQGTGEMSEHSLTWIFVGGMIFAWLDAFGIGANDVANSFATSVGSQVLTLGQACCIALFTEFLGAVMLGANTTNTIRNGILDVKDFAGRPDLLMYGMMCAMIGSSFWVLGATRMSMPVSTTHAIVGAVMGMGIACFGFGSVDWGWDGVGKVIASFAISPIFSGVVASIIFLTTKYCVLIWDNSFDRALYLLPVYTFITIGIVMTFWVTKGTPALKLDEKPIGVQLAIIFGVTGAVTVLSVFMIPFMRRRAEREDAERTRIAQAQMESPSVDGTDSGNSTTDESTSPNDEEAGSSMNKIKASNANADLNNQVVDVDKQNDSDSDKEAAKADAVPAEQLSSVKPLGPCPLWKENKKGYIMWWLNKTILRGINQEVVYYNRDERLQKVHAAAIKYPNKTERVFSWLQVITACMASFAHGANDVANAIGPLSSIFYIWENGVAPGSKSPVPTWILAYGGFGIQCGLLLYGYNIMRSLGNNLTHMSPIRGFSMELGAVLTVLIATYLAIPVSTTHCITGATFAVGLCNGDTKAVNWRMMAWAMFGWLLTLPLAGLIAGLATAFGAAAPNFGPMYPMPN